MTTLTFATSSPYNNEITGGQGVFKVATTGITTEHGHHATHSVVSGAGGEIGTFTKPIEAKDRGHETISVAGEKPVTATHWYSTTDLLHPLEHLALKFHANGKTGHWTHHAEHGAKLMELHVDKTVIATFNNGHSEDTHAHQQTITSKPTLTVQSDLIGIDMVVFSLIIAEQIRDRQHHAYENSLEREVTGVHHDRQHEIPANTEM